MAEHVNTKIPRIYIAATRQNDGKTTACIGLMHDVYGSDTDLHFKVDRLLEQLS